MGSQTALRIVDGLLLLTLFVGTPTIAAAIGYAAWKGRPKTFNRDRFVLGLSPR